MLRRVVLVIIRYISLRGRTIWKAKASWVRIRIIEGIRKRGIIKEKIRKYFIIVY